MENNPSHYAIAAWMLISSRI